MIELADKMQGSRGGVGGRLETNGDLTGAVYRHIFGEVEVSRPPTRRSTRSFPYETGV